MTRHGACLRSGLPAMGYGDEDMVGKVKDMAVAAMPRQMAKQVMKRYIAYACIRWHRQLVDGV